MEPSPDRMQPRRTEPPRAFPALGITLRAEDTAGLRHLAHLAGRIGYPLVWLPATRPPALAELRELVRVAAPARVGLVLGEAADGGAGWLAATRDDPGLGRLPVEIAGGAHQRAAVRAALGAEEYAARVWSRDLDLTGGGHVVTGRDEGEVTRRLVAAREARAAAGRPAAEFPIIVDVAVAIGRTTGEAEARVRLDPVLAARSDLRAAGLFGTFDDAQQRVLAYARAGADGLRATLAVGRDVADLLAHLRAVTVGPVAVLLARGSTGRSAEQTGQ
jgi:hypothetical protein